MGGQQILAPVVGEVPPDRVDVVGPVLGLVVLDQEAWPLHGVVVTFAWLLPAGAGEADALQTGLLDLPPLGRGNLLAGPLDVEPNQLDQPLALVAGHGR